MISGLENPIHLLFILVIALLVLGPKRLPDAGRALGSGIRGFRESVTGRDEPERDDDVEVQPPSADH